jgi:hypothetical protein
MNEFRTTLTTMVAAAASLSACATSPSNNTVVLSSHDVDFDGYAEQPNATIEIYAHNWQTGQFDRVATAQSESSPSEFARETAYHWSLSDLNLDANVPNPDDYWQFTGCVFTSTWYEVQFKAKEVGSRQDYLVTFESDGRSCVLDRVNRLGESWFVAGQACASPSSPVVSLKCAAPICITESCPPNECRRPRCIGKP